MNTELIAIASAAAGVIGALFAGIQTVRTARLKASVDLALEKIRQESALSLESMKEDGERRRKAFELAMQESEPVEAALAQAWRDIQQVKEEIAKVISHVRYDLDLGLKAVGTAVASLVDGYARWGSDLPNDARHAWHSAKGSAGTVELSLRRQLAAHGVEVELPEQVVDALKEARISLTDRQIALAAAREGFRHELVRKLWEDL